jgi:hypothetical protein
VTALVADSAIADHAAPTCSPARPEVATLGSGRGPTRTLVGEVGNHLDVTGHVVVHGTVAAGASVGEDAHLEVAGSLDGPLRVAHGGVVSVHGTYRGDVVLNDGLVLVAGVAALDAVRRRRVAVAYGTLLKGTYGEAWTIDGNGRLRRLDGATSMDVRMAAHLTAAYCLWSDRAGAFLPVEDLVPVS